MESKRVLFLLSRFLDGGIDTVLVEYLNGLAKYTNHSVTLCIAMDYGSDAEVFIDRLDYSIRVAHVVRNSFLTYRKRKAYNNKRNPIVSVLDEILLNPVRNVILNNTLKSLISENDIIIDFDNCFSGFIPKQHVGKKIITFSHFSIRQSMIQNPKRTKRLAERWYKYDNIVCICEAMKEEAMDLMPSLASRFTCIYNPIDIETIFVKSDVPVCDSRVNDSYILAVERLEESQKDLTTLINAYSQCDSSSDSFPLLYIIGEGKSRNVLENLIASKNLSKKVKLLGFVENPFPWIKASEFFVHSSKFEGFGMSIAEALCLGKCIVSSDCPVGPSEILNHGNAGVLVPVNDSKAFSNAMSQVYTDKNLRLQMQQNAKKYSEIFMTKNTITKLEALF